MLGNQRRAEGFATAENRPIFNVSEPGYKRKG
jgi:hypothetical protein